MVGKDLRVTIKQDNRRDWLMRYTTVTNTQMCDCWGAALGLAPSPVRVDNYALFCCIFVICLRRPTSQRVVDSLQRPPLLLLSVPAVESSPLHSFSVLSPTIKDRKIRLSCPPPLSLPWYNSLQAPPKAEVALEGQLFGVFWETNFGT